jgi:transposase
MQSIATVGPDIAKSVFQVHGVDEAGQVIIRRFMPGPKSG